MERPRGRSGARDYVTPGWVKVLGAIALVVAVLLGIAMITGLGGPHGPGRHVPQAGTAEPSAQ